MPRIHVGALLQRRQFSHVAKGLGSQYAAALPFWVRSGSALGVSCAIRNAGLNHII
jgi:hypothetical protein